MKGILGGLFAYAIGKFPRIDYLTHLSTPTELLSRRSHKWTPQPLLVHIHHLRRGVNVLGFTPLLRPARLPR